jgi:hypothetical protein
MRLSALILASSLMTQGNDPVRWNKLLTALDEKLQMNLLSHVRKVAGYHFEGQELLYIEPATKEEEAFLKKEVVLQQLVLFAQEAVGVEQVKIRTAA